MSISIHGTNGITFNDGTVLRTAAQAASAWVNFNGTGTVAIRKGFNVSSITDLGTGSYRINFSTGLSDANFVAAVGCGPFESGSLNYAASIEALATTSVDILIQSSAGSNTDATNVLAVVFD